MSLYKAREWWRTSCGVDEEFELRSVAVGNVDNDPTGQSKIVTGSLHGCLRVHQPHGRDYRADDLMLETQLQAPILQLELGNFAAVGGLQLAVLQPQKLLVCQITSLISGQGTACMQLNTLSQHTLERFLPQFLLPGPLCYSQTMDSFITCSSAFEIQCYKYQTLVAAQAAVDKTSGSEAVNTTQGRRLHLEWQWTFGEVAWDIQLGHFTVLAGPNNPDIILLGEHTLVVLNGQGQLRWQKRFDYQPVAFTTYPVTDGRHNLLVAAATGQMMVYNQSKLVWAAKGDVTPVAIRVAAFANLPGLVLSLNDAGTLIVTYMGTDPPTQAVDMGHSSEVDYTALEAKYRQLTSQIQNLGAPNKAAVPEQHLLITAQVPSLLNSDDALPHDLTPGVSHASLTLQLYVRYTGAESLTDVVISLSGPDGVQLDQDCIVLPHIAAAGADTTAASVQVQSWTGVVPTNNCISGVATYKLPSGGPRTANFQVALPLTLFCQLSPQQTAQHKLTLDTNRPPPPLVDLFEDLVAQSQMDLQQRNRFSNVMSFKYHGGAVVTILVSKTAGRYRIQSDSLPAMWLIIQELSQRLSKFISNAEASEQSAEQAFAISFKESLPMGELWTYVDQHLASRHAVAVIEARLAQLAHQLRAVQRRMLLRFKDKQPASLAHLDLLIQETFLQLQELGHQHEQQQGQTDIAGQQLAATLKLVLQLIRLKFGLSEADSDLLATYLPPEVPDAAQNPGWEELTGASMSHLCSSLGLSNQGNVFGEEQLAIPANVQLLKQSVDQMLSYLDSGRSAPFASVKVT